jgi:hypothetical protein
MLRVAVRIVRGACKGFVKGLLNSRAKRKPMKQEYRVCCSKCKKSQPIPFRPIYCSYCGSPDITINLVYLVPQPAYYFTPNTK